MPSLGVFDGIPRAPKSLVMLSPQGETVRAQGKEGSRGHLSPRELLWQSAPTLVPEGSHCASSLIIQW